MVVVIGILELTVVAVQVVLVEGEVFLEVVGLGLVLDLLRSLV